MLHLSLGIVVVEVNRCQIYLGAWLETVNHVLDGNIIKVVQVVIDLHLGILTLIQPCII